jgi:hypothetical protein
MPKLILTAAAAFLALSAVSVRAECTAASAERRVPLLELYTSEGCDSCPPTDRWVSQLPSRGLAAERVVVLAFHVDYWDRLGWSDRFGQARFSQRQREINDRNRSRVVYTPQLLLNGKDYRRAGDDAFARRIADLNRDRSRALIKLALANTGERLDVNGTWTASGASDAQAWLAIYENRLSSEIKAGENRGKRLDHDYVVRDLAGPYAMSAISHTFALDPRWNRSNVGVAAFVQDSKSGDVLQALTKSICAG